MIEDNTEGPSEHNEKIFSRLWKIKVPRKILFFVWRCLHRSIATANNLKKRGIIVEDLCKVCMKKSETEYHCLIHCQFAREAWQHLLPVVLEDLPSDFSSWLTQQLDQRTSKDLPILFMTLYSLWTNRNKLVFQGKGSSVARFIQIVLEKLEEVQDSSDINSNRYIRPVQRSQWQRPDRDWIKINFDAAWQQNSSQALSGVIGRNEHGQVTIAGSFNMGFCFSAKHAEAVSATKAMDLALMQGYCRVIFESDCKTLVEEINNRRNGFSPEDITEVEDELNAFFLSATALIEWDIRFVKRNANFVADYLAARRRSLATDVIYFVPFPSWLSVLANADDSVVEQPP